MFPHFGFFLLPMLKSLRLVLFLCLWTHVINTSHKRASYQNCLSMSMEFRNFSEGFQVHFSNAWRARCYGNSYDNKFRACADNKRCYWRLIITCSRVHHDEWSLNYFSSVTKLNLIFHFSWSLPSQSGSRRFWTNGNNLHKQSLFARWAREVRSESRRANAWRFAIGLLLC